MAHGAEWIGETVSKDKNAKGERFFFWLNRFNAVAIFVALLLYFSFMIFEMISYSQFSDDFGYQRDSGFDHFLDDFPGDVIETGSGNTISYQVASEGSEELKIDGQNVSFTDMETGKSVMILPDGSEQLIFSWDQVELRGEKTFAYLARVGNETDYDAGFLDLIIGRYSDLEQRTLAQRVRFVDGPQMIDEDTMSVIVWLEPERAEFWLIDLRTLSIAQKRRIALPMPEDDESIAVSAH